uniref:Putative N-acetylmuramoyl-L-alanine amidase n=1 Tax=viral metagenome TaxID=1070528 RepID=A0A6H1Z7T0_9ZZZZ
MPPKVEKIPESLKVSPLARLAPFFGKPRDVTDQPVPARRVCLHITGRATWNHAVKYKQHPLARIEDYFDEAGNPFAHYTIDPWGTIIQSAYETERPWAQGWGAYGGQAGLRKKLRSGSLKIPGWYAKYGGIASPLGLMAKPGDGVVDTPNDGAIAIENVQYGNQFLLTEAQYMAGHMLVLDIIGRHQMVPQIVGYSGAQLISLVRRNLQLFGHEEADPWGRGNQAGGWDPGALRKAPRFCWSCFISLNFGGCPHGAQTVNGRSMCRAVLPTPPKPDWLKKIEDKAFQQG